MRQLTNHSAKTLAKQMLDGQTPVLWLGPACSISVGCFTEESLRERISQILGIEITSRNDLQKSLKEQRYELPDVYPAGSVKKGGLGYSLLAQLIARGYFRVIVDSSSDSLLEDELRVLFPLDSLVVAKRNDRTDQEIARLLGGVPRNTIFILKLNAGRGRSSHDLDKTLQGELGRLITHHGLLFIGHSLAELSLSQLVSDKNKCWFVDPFTSAADFQKGLVIDPDQLVTGADALFDNFFQGLSHVLLQAAVADRLLMGPKGSFTRSRGRIDRIVDGIARQLKGDSLDDVAVEELTRKLLEHIQHFAAHRRDKICLVFANDVESPGGMEIRTLINRFPHLKNLVANYPFFTANITGRTETQVGRRAVTSIHPPLKPDKFEAIVIVDDIAFSGNTLHILRDYLTSQFDCDPGRIVVALLRIDSDVKARLEGGGWHVLYGAEHSGFGFSCPWGFARPTRAKLSVAKANTLADLKASLGVACFMPQSTLGFIPKPWGELIVFRDNALISSRILYLERGQRTSFHYHLLRDEMFFVLDDRLRIRLWDRHIELNKNQSLRIPAGVPHSVIALESACRVLEIAEGYCDPQRDIVRIHDIYEREASAFGDDDGLI